MGPGPGKAVDEEEENEEANARFHRIGPLVAPAASSTEPARFCTSRPASAQTHFIAAAASSSLLPDLISPRLDRDQQTTWIQQTR